MTRTSPAEGARRLIDRYCLDRKLREALRGAGMHGDDAYKGIALAKALLPRLETACVAGAEPAPEAVVAGFEAEGELRALLGFNLFNGVTWFNKERIEEALRLAALFGAMSVAAGGRAETADGGAKDSALGPARCAITIIKACADSGYRLDGLKAALSERQPEKESKADRG